MSLDPANKEWRDALVDLRLRACEWSNYQSDFAELREEIRAGVAVSPALCLAFPCSAAEQFAAAQTRAKATTPARRSGSRNEATSRHGRIRIAYLSGELRNHATGHLFAGVVERHDKARFEVTILNAEPRDDSPVQKRIVDAVEAFVDVAQVDDDRLIELIKKKEIDILVNLDFASKRLRAAVFLARPAPVQVNYLGSPGTAAAPQLRLSHRRSHRHSAGGGEVVRGEDRLSSRLLPTQRFEARDWRAGDLAARGGSSRSGVRLLLLQHQLQAQPRHVRRMVAHPVGLSRQRAVAVAGQRCRGRQPEEERRRRAASIRLGSSSPRGSRRPNIWRVTRLADLFLDGWPYGAHTTASDALWAGLPVLTRVGETFANRVASSLLTAVGLPELIAPDREAFVATAIELAHNPERLRALKEKLERNRATAPLFDTELYTRRLEAAFEAMHARRLANLPPDDIHVPA